MRVWCCKYGLCLRLIFFKFPGRFLLFDKKEERRRLRLENKEAKKLQKLEAKEAKKQQEYQSSNEGTKNLPDWLKR